jgi:hypothetical protein
MRVEIVMVKGGWDLQKGREDYMIFNGMVYTFQL